MSFNFKRSNVPYLLLSLVFSIILFLNDTNRTNTTFFSSNGNAGYEEVVQGVPITVLYNTDKYFAHGFAATTSVKLNGANRVQLNKEMNPDTRDFSVIADLSGLSIGTHEVKLRTKNLSKSISATIEPDTVTVTIEKKVTKKFNVSPVLNSMISKNGVKIGDLSIHPTTVEITTGETTMGQIDRVIASVDTSKLTTNKDSIQAPVQALNANGETLPIQSNPQNVTVMFETQKSSKEVQLYSIQAGNVPENIESFKIELNHAKATVSGDAATLDRIDSIGIPVDISDVKGTVKKMIDIPISKEYQINPKSVTVQITPVFKRAEGTPQTTESSSSSNNSTEQSTTSTSTR